MTQAAQLSPGLIATFGPMGTGKSSDMIATVIGEGVFLGAKNGLQVGTTSFGVPAGLAESLTLPVHNMAQVPEGIQWAAQNGYRAVGIDDGSLLMKTSFLAIQQQHTIVKNGVEKGFDMAMWGVLDRLLYNVAATAQHCGIRVYMNFHQREPSRDGRTGVYFIGGPDLSWKQLTPRLGYYFDLVQQTAKDPLRERWDSVMEADERNPKYTQKNRILDTYLRGSLNTAEMLRASGRVVARYKGLEWMDDTAEALAQSIASGTPEAEAREPFKTDLLGKGIPPKLIRWALRDGTHRARIRASMGADAILGSM